MYNVRNLWFSLRIQPSILITIPHPTCRKEQIALPPKYLYPSSRHYVYSHPASRQTYTGPWNPRRHVRIFTLSTAAHNESPLIFVKIHIWYPEPTLHVARNLRRATNEVTLILPKTFPDVIISRGCYSVTLGNVSCKLSRTGIINLLDKIASSRWYSTLTGNASMDHFQARLKVRVL